MPYNAFNTLQEFDLGDGNRGRFYSLPELEKQGIGQISKLPVSIRIVLESVLRNCDGRKIKEDDVRALASWAPNAERTSEIPFIVARIVLQDFTGVPLLVDLAAMRTTVAGMGKNPVIEIDCVTMRHDAIFKAIQNGSEVEGCIFHKVPFGVAVYNHIKNIGGYVNLHNLLVLPGLFGIVVQMTPRFYGEAKQVLMGVLSSPILHPKVAIAVDEDVNIFNSWEIIWAINTRCNPQEDIVVVPGTRMHPMDPTGFEAFPPGGPFWHRVGGKVIIDATKPPECDPKRRYEFERLRPVGWETVMLEDYLPAGSPPLRFKPKIPGS